MRDFDDLRRVTILDFDDLQNATRNFYGFGFVLWESDRAEGGRVNEKREKMGEESLPG